MVGTQIAASPSMIISICRWAAMIMTSGWQQIATVLPGRYAAIQPQAPTIICAAGAQDEPAAEPPPDVSHASHRCSPLTLASGRRSRPRGERA
jgi:hypothetical protein